MEEISVLQLDDESEHHFLLYARLDARATAIHTLYAPDGPWFLPIAGVGADDHGSRKSAIVVEDFPMSSIYPHPQHHIPNHAYSAYPMFAVPIHVDPPSLVVRMTRSTPNLVSAGAVPPGQRTPKGHVTTALPPFVSLNRIVFALPLIAPVKMNIVAPLIVAMITGPALTSIVSVSDTEPRF